MRRGTAVRPFVTGGTVRSTLAPFARARARQRSPDWAARGFVAGVALDLLVTLALVTPPSLPLFAIASRSGAVDRGLLLVPPLLFALVGFWLATARTAPLRQVAREVDLRLGLAERVGTAYEIETDVPGSGERAPGLADLAARQQADALAWLGRFDPVEVFPIQIARRELGALALALLALFALVGLPEIAGRGPDRASLANVTRAEAETLAALAEELARLDELNPDDPVLLAHALQEAAQRLEAENLTPEQAIAALTEAERSLLRRENPNAADRELALARLADALDRTGSGREIARLLDRRQFAEAAGALEQLIREANQLAPAERRALADALNRAAAATRRLDPTLGERLREGAEALAGDDRDGAAERIAEAMQRASREALSQRALERALAALAEARQTIARAERGNTPAGREQPGGRAGQDGMAGQGQTGDGRLAGAAGNAADGLPGDQRGGEGTSGAGEGTLRRTGDNPANDFGSRVVRIPSGDFGQPQVRPGQQTDEGPIGEAVVDYRQVLTEYRARATEAMADRAVPLGLKELVRDYFSTLGGSRPGSAP